MLFDDWLAAPVSADRFPVGTRVTLDGRLGVVIAHTASYVLVQFGWERPPADEWPHGLDTDLTLVSPQNLQVAK